MRRHKDDGWLAALMVSTPNVEARVESACGVLGAGVHRFSVRRRSTHIALPDFRVYGDGWAFWFEAKTRTDKLTEAQYAFLKREHYAGQHVAAGDVTELVRVIRRLDGFYDDARAVGWQTVEQMMARGLRAVRSHKGG